VANGGDDNDDDFDEIEGEEDEEDEDDSSLDGEDDVDADGDDDADDDGEAEGEDNEDDINDADVSASARALDSGAATTVGDETDSEDEAPINTIGNVPLEWYDGFDHVGYDIDGRKIMRGARGDELDALIKRFDDPNSNRTVHDALHGVDVTLSADDIALIRRLQKHRYPHADVDPYPEMIITENEDKLHPLSNAPPRKAPFLPSKHEAKKVMRLVMAMRSESYQISVANRRKQDDKDRPNYQYLIWDETPDEDLKHHKRLPAPKLQLPGNAESYNPPAEYLFTPEEEAAWHKMDPSDRPLNFVPHKFGSLRRVPLYEPLIKERFERCLDLYLCPRAAQKKLDIAPDSLIPSLPSAAELRPFPERLSERFVGHSGRVYSLSVSPSGQWLLSASADATVRLWEVSSGRCERSWQLGAEVRCVAWNPNAELAMAAAVVGSRMLLMLPLQREADVQADEASARAAGVLAAAAGVAGDSVDGEVGGVPWVRCAEALAAVGVVWEVSHAKSASSVRWHHKGDYLASVAPDGASRAVLLHQVSKRQSGSPFAKSKGRVEAAAFHPTKPYLFVATQRHVRMYDLAQQELVKKLNPAAKWISSIDVHPSGDHVILGSYDKRLCWFDLDMSATPYKTLRSHTLAVRAVAFHPKLPLFASAADDGHLHIYHGRVYSDLLTNALIVPLKILKGHKITDHLGVMGIAFHPTQPWIFSAGADGDINLYTG